MYSVILMAAMTANTAEVCPRSGTADRACCGCQGGLYLHGACYGCSRAAGARATAAAGCCGGCAQAAGAACYGCCGLLRRRVRPAEGVLWRRLVLRRRLRRRLRLPYGYGGMTTYPAGNPMEKKDPARRLRRLHRPHRPPPLTPATPAKPAGTSAKLIIEKPVDSKIYVD